MRKFLRLVPTILFNSFEFILLAIIGVLVGIQWYEAISILITFMLSRNLIGKGKHYRNPNECLFWSSLIFGVLFYLATIDYTLSLLLTVVYATAQTNKVDVSEMFMWKSKSTSYDYIRDFILDNKDTPALIVFEYKLEKFNPKIYDVYRYRFIKGYSFHTIGEILDLDNRRISEILKSLELAINLYFDIK